MCVKGCYHDSDCAVHNEPALPAKICTCTGRRKLTDKEIEEIDTRSYAAAMVSADVVRALLAHIRAIS